ncbi:coiled-coil domain-containing protein 137-like [Xenia sp. Carnegie-2017]|uniref:coiled-coil domain-containing protein 137-like n=1 Tax=Xenia sp. Carnegie-2017 TaxID=2897299 RepID=UPI001F038A0F|nr:coiled-coil domain-containing protein 137-like [Xenia sp. Carnegie-2017]
MGRLSRHRKIKSCDPFYKGRKIFDTSSNNPVNVSQLDHQPVPRKAKTLLNVRISVKQKEKKKVVNNGVRKQLDIDKKPGETRREFYQRLDKEAAEEINKILLKQKHVSQKRKEFLKIRKQKRKGRKLQDLEKDFTTEKIKFGDIVEEPPSFTATPKQKTEASKNDRVKSLLLNDKFKSNADINHEQEATIPLKTKKRKHMNAFEKQISDKVRLDAINAYRNIKKKRSGKT